MPDLSSLYRRGMLGITERTWVRRLFTEYPVGRRLATRFVAGEGLDDAVAVAGALNRSGISVSMDHLGEHVYDAGSASEALADYMACLDQIEAEHLDANVSVKLTQLGLAVDPSIASDALAKLAKRAAAAGTTVTVDMEESIWTEATIELYEEIQPRFGNLGVAVQAYLHRTEDDLRRIMALGGHIRLCKGAYVEPPEVAVQDKRQVDARFRHLLTMLMGETATHPAIATHDNALISDTYALARSRDGSFEFQMLYGVRPTLQQEILEKGYRLRIYVPYGSQWYPYLTRRMAERPANLALFLRAVVGK
ncbi:MAG: proline dehydrogenase family protein [Acidimicrobiia bacterium]|nr:proline dehydrogenase family protein [Acidimicrobiia bacterium]